MRLHPAVIHVIKIQSTVNMISSYTSNLQLSLKIAAFFVEWTNILDICEFTQEKTINK